MIPVFITILVILYCALFLLPVIVDYCEKLKRKKEIERIRDLIREQYKRK